MNDAIRHIVGIHSFTWAREKQEITTVADQQEYDVADDCRKVYQVYYDNEPLTPINYEDRADYSVSSSYKYFYLTPDKTKIGFIKTPTEDGDTIDVWYYQQYQDINSTSDTFNINIPTYMLEPIVLYIKHLVHDSKRQRLDARNTIFDFVEAIKEAISKDVTRKPKDNPKQLPHPWKYLGFKRSYTRG